MAKSYYLGKVKRGISNLVHHRRAKSLSYISDDDEDVITTITSNNNNNNNTREGYLTVVAEKGREKKRFSIELDYLNDPEFKLLLDQAQQEYGFRQKGALSVPCRPHELQKILDGGNERRLSRS
ncbi:auxin-induced protein X15 [Arachis duranensis]|uniref:Auxin-induced protein n=2 Tax=Arachis TaxID=3817 RepID=A0A445E7E0_ARAHY|nr:auxin-induced protein X15-like [Arachis hypogaea]XP_025636587.1 auxin-induced protein X15-like [Arachis hypogaea]XP_052113952.1 auxin-induced protein X15 [Arachis duranensis]XP_057745739.1 auxin-induced protein X15-like [Arachis stenosperma]QHO26104.1 Auxin-responsive protein [Arachis hypogaea]RYR71229.1 hypothetical protein Ahy_A02g005511 isoform A [Arachis hypogaea]